MHWQRILFLILMSGCVGRFAGATQETVAPFQLPGIDGSPVKVELDPQVKCWIICFLGTECPMVQRYIPRLNELAVSPDNPNVRVIGVGSNSQDTLSDLQAFSKQFEVNFAMAKDHDQVIADALSAQRTPEVFVLNSQLQVIYRGAIDDQFLPGVSKSAPAQEFLKDAVRAVLSGTSPAKMKTEAAGCLIGRTARAVEKPTVTFSNQVSRVLQKHCGECHREGAIGPFALDDFDSAKGWSSMCLEVIENGRMPPWNADPTISEFSNARSMPEADKEILRRWIDEGCPFGSATELPEPAQYADGWRLPRTPDQVVRMSTTPYKVPADGTVDYQYFVVDPGFTEDKWVVAAEVKPGNRRVVHHSIAFVRPPDGTEFRGLSMLSAYVPGQTIPETDPRRGRFVPKGSRLVFQQHYTPTGKPETDVTEIGLIFGDDSQIQEEMLTLIAIDQEFVIPPRVPDYRVAGEVTMRPLQGRLLSVAPHMHYRGKAFELSLRIGERTEKVLSVPQYDFNWQHSYRWSQTWDLSQVDAIEFLATFDNSEDNPFNPDPQQSVAWGDQTWEEMAVAFLEVSVPRTGVEWAVGERAGRSPSNDNRPLSETELQKSRDQEVESFMQRFDKNSDGFIVATETPTSFKHFGFWKFDLDGDRRISLDEVRTAFRHP